MHPLKCTLTMYSIYILRNAAITGKSVSVLKCKWYSCLLLGPSCTCQLYIVALVGDM